MTTHTNAEALHQAAHEWAIEAYNKGLGRPCDIDGKRNRFDVLIRQQAQEIEECNALRQRMSDLLTATANALKGQPEPLSLHDWSGLPSVAAKQAQEIERLTKALSGKREIFQAGRDSYDTPCVPYTNDDDAWAQYISDMGASE